MNKDKFAELDALRGIASLVVVVAHYNMFRPGASDLFMLGTVAVDLFFIVSGLVIFMSINRVKTNSDFVVNRVSRLYPTYWTCVTITFLIIVMHKCVTSGRLNSFIFIEYLANLTMFQHYLNINNIDGPYWTLIVEMTFYISMFLLLKFKLIKHYDSIGILLIIILPSLLFLFEDTFIKNVMFWFPALQFAPLFFVGSIFYKLHTQKDKKNKNYILVILCLISQIILFPFSGRSYLFISQIEYALMLCIVFFLFILFANKKLNFIVCKPTLFLGKISYPLYLIHQYISIDFMIPFFIKRFNMSFWVASFVVTLPIILIIAAIITKYVDTRMVKLMRKKLRIS